MAQKMFKTMVPSKYLNNFWGTLELLFIWCEINIDLNGHKRCVILATDVENQTATFSVADKKL